MLAFRRLLKITVALKKSSASELAEAVSTLRLLSPQLINLAYSSGVGV